MLESLNILTQTQPKTDPLGDLFGQLDIMILKFLGFNPSLLLYSVNVIIRCIHWIHAHLCTHWI